MSQLIDRTTSDTRRALRLPDHLCDAFAYAANQLKGNDRRRFMAETVSSIGCGGQRMAEKTLGWNRGTIRKAIHELQSGIHCVDNFAGRGRKPVEHYLPNLNKDIQQIVKPSCQADPTFRTTNIYTPLTAKAVRIRLIENKKYNDENLPTIRTICNRLNQLNFLPQKVLKCKPFKKIPETDSIFSQVFQINKMTDNDDRAIRLSVDAKAKVNIGHFSRGGKSRQGEKASDHDFAPEEILTPVGFFLPNYDETYLYFTESKVTADFIVDCLELLWPILKLRFDPDTIVLNLDNGPENNSHRTQFVKRIVAFAHSAKVTVKLAYYPPYHSKYNPIERVWGVLENHWNGEILDSVEKTLAMAQSMTYNGVNPKATLVKGDYPTGVKLKKKEMTSYEKMILRQPNLKKWFVTVPSGAAHISDREIEYGENEAVSLG